MIEEIEKRKKEIDDELESINKEDEVLTSKLNEIYQKKDELNSRYKDLKMEKISLIEPKFELNKYYIEFDPEDRHYNLFTLFYITSLDRNDKIEYISHVFRSDDCEPSFSIKLCYESFKTFVFEHENMVEIPESEARNLSKMSFNLNDEKIFEWRKNFIKEHDIELH